MTLREEARELAKRRAAAPSPVPEAGEAAWQCELCLRETSRITVHHLVPKARGGRFGPKASLCSTCHRQLHAVFSVATLAQELDSIEAIEANPEMARYLKWARRQKGQASFPVRRSNHRR